MRERVYNKIIVETHSEEKVDYEENSNLLIGKQRQRKNNDFSM